MKKTKIYRTRILLALSAVILATGCATTPIPSTAPATTPTPTTESVKPVFGKGGYYLDDGPDESPPSNLDATPDAVPKDEPPHRFANRPYDVLGSHYEPDTSNKVYKQQGMASWYGRKFKGKKTASGEIYDMYAMTAAHRTLPIPSYVRVTNPKNKRSVVVRVNDRGPFHPNRIIDLSYTAALKLGLINGGSGMVEVERIFSGDVTSAKLAQAKASASASASASAQTALMPTQTPETSDVVASNTAIPNTGGVFIQLGAFGALNTAENFRDKVQQDLAWLSETIQILARDGFYRVRLGPYTTRTEATAIADKIRQTLDFSPHIAVQ
ncbi:MAG: septal ring lytic transglycosylase RlpA family protein [Pseudomonadota bacterium]